MPYFCSAFRDQLSFNYHDISGLKAKETNLVSLERPYGIHSGQSLMFALDLRWEVCNLGPTMEEKTIICTCNPSLCWS